MSELTPHDQVIMPGETRATKVRFLIVIVTALAAVLLYLHRFCMAYAQQFIKEDLGMSDSQIAWCFFAFFFSYALAQVPSGWLSDRFGAHVTLTAYILTWSLFTVLMGFTTGFVMLLAIRLGAGIGQAGAYPTSAAILSKWVPLSFRGAASSLIAVGGRVGGAVAPLVTGYLVLWFVPVTMDATLSDQDLLNRGALVEQLNDPTAGSADESVKRARKYIVDRLAAEGSAPSAESDPVALLNQTLAWGDLYNKEQFEGIKLEREANSLLAVSAGELTEQQRVRLNRLLLEAVFPDSIRKLYVAGWRPTMMLLGSLGLAVALAFAFVHRNLPGEHPWCNQAEVELIQRGRPTSSAASKASSLPIKAMVLNKGVTLLCIAQFGTNVGWVFLVTLLPNYLKDAHGVPFEVRNWMAAVPMIVGWFGMIGGGWATDILSRYVSPRWSRALPISLSRFAAMAAYSLCLFDLSPWTVTILFAVVAFSTDFGSAPMWAFNQDIGGQYVGSVLGWGNMWGNLGAAVAPPLMQYIADHGGWNGAFTACSAAFFIAGVCALGADASKPLVVEEE